VWGPSLHIYMISVIAGSMTSFWKPSCCQKRQRNIRHASAANAVLPLKTSEESRDMKNTWRYWPILNTKNMETCCNGEVSSIQNHLRQTK